MSQDRNDLFDPRIAEWLEDGPDRAPSEVLDILVSALPSIPQRQMWRFTWTSTLMPRLASLAAIVAVLVIGSITVVSSLLRPGLTTPSPSAPSASPSPVVSTPPAFTPASPKPNPRALWPYLAGQVLPAGTYYATLGDYFFGSFGISLPDGWVYEIPDDGYQHSNDFHLRNAGDGGVAGLAMYVMDKVNPDPCHTEIGPREVRPGVDALVAALSSMVGFDVQDVREVRVAGLPGNALTLTNSIDTATAACTGGDTLPIGSYVKIGDPIDADENISTSGGSTDPLWIVDVEGQTVLIAPVVRDASAESLLEAQTMVDGIWFMLGGAVAAAPDPAMLDQAFVSAVNHVSFDYPAAWQVVPGDPILQTGDGLHQDWFAAHHTQFFVTAEELQSGVTAEQWLGEQSPPPSQCGVGVNEELTIGGVAGYLIKDNCYQSPGLSGWDTWSEAVAAADGRGYRFTFWKEGLDATAWLKAILATVEFNAD